MKSISVKKAHIEHAKCGAAQKCMIAVAIKTTDPTISYVAVRTNGITVTRRRRSGESIREHWQVPLHAAKAIVAFDNKEEVHPFTFTPKLIDRQLIPARTPHSQEANKTSKAAIRERRKRDGERDPSHRFRNRIAGL